MCMLPAKHFGMKLKHLLVKDKASATRVQSNDTYPEGWKMRRFCRICQIPDANFTIISPRCKQVWCNGIKFKTTNLMKRRSSTKHDLQSTKLSEWWKNISKEMANIMQKWKTYWPSMPWEMANKSVFIGFGTEKRKGNNQNKEVMNWKKPKTIQNSIILL